MKPGLNSSMVLIPILDWNTNFMKDFFMTTKIFFMTTNGKMAILTLISTHAHVVKFSKYQRDRNDLWPVKRYRPNLFLQGDSSASILPNLSSYKLSKWRKGRENTAAGGIFQNALSDFFDVILTREFMQVCRHFEFIVNKPIRRCHVNLNGRMQKG